MMSKFSILKFHGAISRSKLEQIKAPIVIIVKLYKFKFFNINFQQEE